MPLLTVSDGTNEPVDSPLFVHVTLTPTVQIPVLQGDSLGEDTVILVAVM